MIKRILDILIAGLGLIVFFPVVSILILLIWYKLGSPILFKQSRPGLFNKIFELCKFRTMTLDTDKDGKYLSDEQRLTKFGKFIRTTSMDELPSLWNVLKGDMSIVGPRPLLVEYLPLYTSEQKRRHEVKPGITGWAQVNGRNSISWEEKFAMDVWYVENQSLLLDFKIIILTIKRVVMREGINSTTNITMEKFKGTV